MLSWRAGRGRGAGASGSAGPWAGPPARGEPAEAPALIVAITPLAEAALAASPAADMARVRMSRGIRRTSLGTVGRRLRYHANIKMSAMSFLTSLEPQWLQKLTVERWVYRNVCPELGS